jgi:phage terminase large subunit GpA-like protein
MTMFANAQRLVHEAIAAAVRPPAPIDYLKFAEANIVFGPGEPRPGPYDRNAFGYFDEILRALGPDDPCRIVSLKASAQLGKTVLGNIFVLGSVSMGRGTTLIVHPTIENAARWSRMKLSPMMRSVPAVSALFPQRPRDAADAILYKERADGLANLLVSGANSAASLSQLTAAFQLQDDLAKWEANSAGDPEAQADSRSRAHEFGKIFKASTPMVHPTCKITRDFAAGSQEMPHVPCVHCNHMHVLEWSNFHFEQPDNPYFVCPSCGGVIEERHRSAMLAGFRWVAKNPDAGRTHRSFWLWSAYSVLQSWTRIAAEWTRAQGDGSAEQTFWTDTLGLAYEPKGEARPPHELAARASRSHYSRGEVPEGALVLTLGIDCQLDRCEWQLIGHGEHYRKFVIDIGTIGKHISEPDAQRNIDLLLQRRWTNFRGRQIGLSLTGIDANWSTDDVLAFAHRYPPSKLIAIRGVPGDNTPRIARVQRERSEKTGTILKFSKRFYNIGVYSFKSSLYRDLAKDDPKEKGYISFPNNLPLSYFEELVCERRVPYKRMGVLAYRWEKPDKQANEMHDTFLYASAAAIKYGVNFISDQGWAQRRAEFEAPESAGGGRFAAIEPVPLWKRLASATPQPPSSEFRIIDRR